MGKRMLAVWLLGMMVYAGLTGCGGSSSSNTDKMNADVNGLWSNYHTPAGDAEYGPELWTFAQSGTTGEFTVTDSLNDVSNGTINGSSVTVDKASAEGVYTLTGTVSENTMSGTYSATDGSSGTWRTVKVKLISATSSTTTITVNGTTTFVAAAVNYDDTTASIGGGAGSGLSWAVSDASVVSVDANGVAKGIKEGTAVVTASYRGLTSAGVTLIVTAATNGGTGAGTSGTLTISLDLSSAATVTTAPALVSVMVYTGGTLAAISANGIAITNKSGSLSVRQPVNPAAAAVLDPGLYRVYILIDDNGNGAMDTGELGWAGTITINGNSTRNLTTADFVQTTGVAVTVTGSTVPDGASMRCDWLAPGGVWQADTNTSTVIQGFSLAFLNTFSGGSVITDTNTPLIPIGKYDLHCWVDTDGNSALNTGDFFGTLTAPTLVVTGTPISMTVVP